MDITIAMGYKEDLWHSSRLHSHQMFESISKSIGEQHTVNMFAPELG